MLAAHIALFNDERYHRINARPGQRLFHYDYCLDGELVGTLSGVICGEVLECGHSAPYGGIDFRRPAIVVGTIVDLLQGARRSAAAEGARAILVKARPGYYGENETTTVFALLGLGATLQDCELSLGLETWQWRTVEDYEIGLKSSARRILRRALGAGLPFAAATGAGEWAGCWEVLAETRRRRGAQMRISLDYAMRVRDTFGQRIAMYRLGDAEDPAAAALVYRVMPDRDYVVAWGDAIRHRPEGVMNAMAYHLVRQAIAQDVRLIDLGISSVGGAPDDGLIQFKRNIGAVTGLRLDLQLAVG
jgi:hypothetical protein